LRALDPKPEFGIILIGTGFDISLGNRGRVDVNVEVRGKATHSSAPEAGLSAIDGANELLNRLRRLALTKEHPLLGGQHAIPYQVRYEPLAPHTLPERAFIRIDRRLLPGDDVDEAAAQIREAIGDLTPYEVTVERGVFMLPALVDPETPGVRALQTAHTAVRGEPARTVHGRGAFDAGGPCAAGVPTVMYGVSGGVWMLGDDFVPLNGVEDEAKVLAHLIISELA
jgi:acetylornithine deacetylase/succinyl-diaminopimelate desuccinylase-like protein